MTKRALQVMTYNSHHSTGNDDCTSPPVVPGELPNADCGLDIERLASVVRLENPDIVGLQEVDRYWGRSGYTDQPDKFSKILDMQVAFGPNLDHPADEHANVPHQFGVATLTPHPITHNHNYLLPNLPGWEQRGLLDTRIHLSGIGEIAVLNTHLQVAFDDRQVEASQQRRDQAEAIAAHVGKLDIPVIVLGDFNTQIEDGELDALIGPNGNLSDAWGAMGEGAGNSIFLASFPAYARIDFILVSRHFTVEAIRVIDTDLTRIASDHLPVVADLTINS